MYICIYYFDFFSVLQETDEKIENIILKSRLDFFSNIRGCCIEEKDYLIKKKAPKT